MVKVSKNKMFTSIVSGNVIKVRNVIANKADWRHSLVEVATVGTNGRIIKSTVRTIYQDSIRRWYF